MPAPNDMTPEEEQEFINHGVQPSGPGSEPVVESQNDIQAREGEPPVAPVAPEQPTTPAEPPTAPAEPKQHRRADGTFMSAEEIAALPPAPPAEPEPPKMVPLAALHGERERAANAIKQQQLLTARMNAMLMAQQQPGGAAPQASLPDLAEDPVGYIQAMEARLAAFENERAQETQHRQLDSALEQDEQLFAQSVPDYDKASDHYVNSRAQELLQFYPPEEAKKILTNEARQIAQQAWQRGMSAGQMVYTLAQARGYAPGNTAANPSNAPIPPRPAGPTPQAVVAGITAGQGASRSLSGAGGGTPAAQLNAEAVLAMSDEEFEQYIALGSKGANARFAAIG